MAQKVSLARSRRRMLTAAGLVVVASGASLGCLDRKIAVTEPITTNVFVDLVDQQKVTKIDLLFVIDNSTSMGDKQALIKEAIPELLNRLINPDCVDSTGAVVGTSVNGTCTDGTADFTPVNDMHIGVISSSMGSMGGFVCSTDMGTSFHFSMVDNGHLLNRTEASLSDSTGSWNGDVVPGAADGFLTWDGTQAQDDLSTTFKSVVSGVGELGCGFEAPLEAWYHFLVDPYPWKEILVNSDGARTDVPNKGSYPSGIDEDLLAQRAQFLRPDSLVTIMMVTDEDDCSVTDYGYGNLLTGQSFSFIGTDECVEDGPNSSCCRPCQVAKNEGSTPKGCTSYSNQNSCSTTADARGNLRCWDQKRRFGYEFLQPTSRYVSALQDKILTVRNPEKLDETIEAANPLYSNIDGSPYTGQPRLGSSLVFLAGLVGVPWQDIATDDSLDSSTDLTYLTAEEINDKGIWSMILPGEDGVYFDPPTDPFMVAWDDPRTDRTDLTSKSNPRTGTELTAVGSRNVINGWEWNTSAVTNGDLQYACIYKLPTPTDCSAEIYAGGVKSDATLKGCDCYGAGNAINPTGTNKPLCTGTDQTYAKAYPGLRILEVLNQYGDNSIVASICPKNPDLATADTVGTANVGYNPAVQAVLERLKEQLKGSCLARPLALTADNDPACVLAEVTFPSQKNVNNCDSVGRSKLSSDLEEKVRKEYIEQGKCNDDIPGLECDSIVICALDQAEGDELDACLNDVENPEGTGWCYIDAELGYGNEELVAPPACPAANPRMIRYISEDPQDNPLPANQATVFLACQGAASSD